MRKLIGITTLALSFGFGVVGCDAKDEKKTDEKKTDKKDEKKDEAKEGEAKEGEEKKADGGGW